MSAQAQPDLMARVAALEMQIATLMDTRGRRAYMSDVVRFQLPKVLPDLMRKHPTGVTTQIVADHFGFPLPTVVSAVGRLVKAGKLARFRHPRQRAAIILPPGAAPPPEPVLTAQRRRILNELIRQSVNGVLESSLNQIAFEAAMCPSTINYQLKCLVKAGKVRVLKRGAKGEPSQYFIPSAIQ